jgi:hypothetical protein
LKQARGEEAIKARLRQLTERTRQIRKELEQMLARDEHASRHSLALKLQKRKPDRR